MNMRFSMLSCLCCLVLLPLIGISQTNLQQYQVAAREAYKVQDFRKFRDLILEAHKIHPYHQGILYQVGLAYALNDQPEKAISFLTKAIHIKADFDLSTPDLASLRAHPDFISLQRKQEELIKPIIDSDTAFVIRQKDLHIEAIASGEAKGVFYLGSIHKKKIIKTDETGKTTDFTTSGQDGLSCVFGIKVDSKKNLLWACASPFPIMENYDSTVTSGVFQYDIKTKRLLNKYTPDDNLEHAFGDLTLDSKGVPFISDSKSNTIYTIDTKKQKLIKFFESEEFWNIQGITFSDDGRYMFIADYVKGIFRLTIKDKTLIQLNQNFETSLKSIDGLTYHKNSLIAIQNLIVPMRTTIYRLNDTMDSLTAAEIIDRGHPAFNEPTIGCVSDNVFHYVANSLWSGYTKDNKLKPESELQEVVVLKYKMRETK